VITCRLCGIKGHYQTHYPVAKNEAGEELTLFADLDLKEMELEQQQQEVQLLKRR